MADQIQLRRGTASQVAAFTGAQGEPIADTTNNRLVLQDGSTAGGFPAAKLSEVQTNTYHAVSDANYTVLTTDRMIAYTALTATRTVTLPAAASFPIGTPLVIFDVNGLASLTSYINVVPNGSDTISGYSSFGLHNAYDCIILTASSGIWNFIGFVNRSLFGNRNGATQIISGATTLKVPFGQSVEFTGSSAFTVTLTSPPSTIAYTPTLDLYNASSATITLTASSGEFVGPKGTSTSTMTMTAGTTLYMEFDATNWVCKR